MSAKNSKIIWTHHARQRLKDRGLSEPTVEQAIRHADSERPGKKAGTREFSAEFDGHTITAVVAPNDQNELVIVSCWVDPPFEGTKAWRKKQRWYTYRTLPWWQKIIWVMLKQLGIWDF
ncbi:DUF4258 domain-containing protein [Candidatus Woesebacteria bacterium]|nr:DUF4258 domain-containing protein [Candidatus Woesebacteria bacterium]MCD8507392.1 DUF4258 domain-containing protein [Candidatus Woesebacteria bacterium]MCD8527022.1 DUF4258 domain-containing protein [Candidatus Woesebacteria bacterium]MCD8545913.1 DUF4258 domain-containing protein [Candidatus Woesebacteria bacterium]